MLTLLTQAAALPLPISEVKNYLRVDHSDEDDLIAGMIEQAVELVERRTHRALGSQQWRLVVSCFSSVELPRPPFASLQSVTYLSTDSTRKAWAEHRIENLGSSSPARMILKSTPSDLDSSAGDAWRIEYTAGGEELPRGLRSALLLIIRRLFDERSGDDDAPILSKGIERLLKIYTVPNR